MPLNIKWIGSPNFTPGRNSEKPEAIVIHIMEGTLAGTDSWFQNPSSKVSAHFGIGKKGDIHQYVKEADTAYHAGRVNAPSWKNIKHSTSSGYKNPNLYTIGIEHEGNETSDWTTEMYSKSAELIRELAAKWNIPINRDHIIGHREIYSLKTCPGSKVDLAKLIHAASAPQTDITPPAPLAGSVITKIELNIRLGAPNTHVPIVRNVPAGTRLDYAEIVTSGESVSGNSKWYKDRDGNYFWSGGVV